MNPLHTLRIFLFLSALTGGASLFGQGMGVYQYQCPAPVVHEQKYLLEGLAAIDEKASISFSGDQFKVCIRPSDLPGVAAILERHGLAQCTRVQRIAEPPPGFVGGTLHGTISTGSGERAVIITQR